MQVERVIAQGQLVKFTFMQADVAASQSAAGLTPAEVRDVVAAADDQNAADGYVSPWAFDIVGVSVRASAARTAGTLTVQPTKNGTAVSGLTAVLNATNTQSHYGTLSRNTNSGAAGDRVGCNITTDASWAPVTADIVVDVWAIVYIDADAG